MPATDDSVALDLRLDVPKDAKIGTSTLTVNAEGPSGTHVTLPIAVTLAKELPAKLSIQPQLPELRGASNSNFEYTLTVKNDSGKKLLVSLAASAPQNFDTSLHRGLWHAAAHRHPGRCRQDQGREAESHAAVDGRCRPLSGDGASRRRGRRCRHQGHARHHRPTQARHRRPQGLLSARATAGKDATIPITVSNTGTAPAEHVKLSGTAPNGWKISFEPQDDRPHRAQPEQGSAGDSSVRPKRRSPATTPPRISASARGETGSAQFPRHRHHLDHVGRRRRRHHRRRAADHGRRGRPVRPAMSAMTEKSSRRTASPNAMARRSPSIM